MSSNPKMSAIQIKALLKPFVREIMISKATINAIRRIHRNETYGDKGINVTYLQELAGQLQSIGHKAEVLSCNISVMKEMSKKVAASTHRPKKMQMIDCHLRGVTKTTGGRTTSWVPMRS